VLGRLDVERLQGVAACWSAGLEARLAEDSHLGVVRSDVRGHQEQPAWAVACLRVLVWVRVAAAPLGSQGLLVADALVAQ
jgi:hypothetical protein